MTWWFRLACEAIFMASFVFTVWINRPVASMIIVGTVACVLGVVGGVSLMDRIIDAAQARRGRRCPRT